MPRSTISSGAVSGVDAPPGHPQPPFPANFGSLSFFTNWRKTWTHIVPGKFSGPANPYDGLLLYDSNSGDIEFCSSDGQGGILRFGSLPGWRPGWTHIVRGRFHYGLYTDLLFYDQVTGIAQVYQTDGEGGLQKMWEYNWPTTWTHIATVRSIGSDFSGLVLYAQALGQIEVQPCNGNGKFTSIPAVPNAGAPPTAWTHVAGDFFSTAEVFFYDGVNQYAEVWQIVEDSDGNHTFAFAASSQTTMPAATDVIAGNFGTEHTTVLLYDRPTGTGSFVFYDSGDSGPPAGINFQGEEQYTTLPTTLDIIVAGDFWGSDTEDYKFQNGFSDLLFYDRTDGTAQFCFHEADKMIVCRSYEGYANPSSVVQGGTIQFFVNSRVGAYRIKIYLQAVTQNLMATIDDVLPIPTPFPIGRQDYRDGPSWPAAAEFQIPENWPSGLYLARIEWPTMGDNAGGGDDSSKRVERFVETGTNYPPYDIPFVVRTKNPGSQSKILVVIPDCTYESYNFWGGRSLYGFWSRGGGVWNTGSTSAQVDNHQTMRSFRVSRNRPYIDVFGFPQWQMWETPLIQWLDRMGIEVEICTGTDIHIDQSTPVPTVPAGLLSNYHMFVSVGHDEYWSKEMRDAVEGFVADGGNAAFFSANVCWWQIRFDQDPSTGAPIRQVCYKDKRFDPIIPDNPSLATVNWYDIPACRAETTLTGVSWYNPGGIPYSDLYHVLQADHWVFETLEFDDNSRFGVYAGPNRVPTSVVGLEVDLYQPRLLPGEIPPPPLGYCVPQSPENFVKLAYVPGIKTVKSVTEIDLDLWTAMMGIFQSGKGQVFTAATTSWPLGLNGASAWTAIDQITLNVFNRFR
jgi:hypothetical protein